MRGLWHERICLSGEHMWDDFIQEEIRRGSLHETQQVEDEEEKLTLAGKGKVKAKKKPSDGATS